MIGVLFEVVADGRISESYSMPDHDDSHHLVTGGETQEINTVTVNTTLNNTHHTVLVDAAGGNRVITLPSASTSNHRVFMVLKIDAGVNTVTVDGDGLDTINGGANQILSSQYDKVGVQCNGTEWVII